MKKLINFMLLTALMVCQYSCIDCEHTDEPVMPEEEIPVEVKVIVTTGEVSDITSTSAIITGSVENIETLTEGIVGKGIMFNTDSIVSQGSYKYFRYYNGRENGWFAIAFDDLEPGTTYYYRACVVVDNSDYTKSDYYYGEVKSFRTEEKKEVPSSLGTKETPVSVSEVKSAYVDGSQIPAWVTGYIVGCVDGMSITDGAVFSASTATNTNILISDNPSTTSASECIPVQLPAGAVREALNLVSNPGNLGKKVKLNGSVEKYFGVVGFKSVTEYEIDDEITLGQEVDLGLSVKWAGWNVGASSPEQYGGYYAWGETEEKSVYDYNTYKYGNMSTGEYINIGSNISGTQYDVAHVKWGNGWRMPTKEELEELETKCTLTDYTYNGVRGCKVTGPNGNSIFLPCAGWRDGTSLYGASTNGYYRSGSLETANTVWILYVLSNRNLDVNESCYREWGLSVRPVR